MIARITRILLLLQLAVAIGLFIFAIKVWHIDSIALALLLSVGLVLLLRVLITANNFYIAWLYRSETPTAFHLDWRQALALFRDEFNATLSSSSWSMAFRPFHKRSVKDPVGLPVLLIHGYGCNSGYWHAMSKVLAKGHITHYAVDLEPVLADIDSYVPIVHRAVEAVCLETGHDKIIIVAHSMGGLVARAYLRDHGSDHIARIITLGTPHRGTGLANFGVGLNSKQMQWTGTAVDGVSSAWLRQLEAGEDQATHALFVSIYSHHDNIVSPQSSSELPGANNIEFHGIGHVALALNPAIQARVLDEINEASRQTLSDIVASPVRHTQAVE